MLALHPVRGLHLVLSLREDYLGLFEAQAYGRKQILDHKFRLGPLTVGEMAQVACDPASKGTPPQRWSKEELSQLMRQVRVAGHAATDGAEVQTAFAQIVCRALWEERAKGSDNGLAQAESMLHRYLETKLEGLGPLKPHARRLLEEHLVASDGSRKLLMEREARDNLPGLSEQQVHEVLTQLESAAILHAEKHPVSRYFELGHDWLARKVFDLRQERLRQEEAERLRQEQQEKAKKERERRSIRVLVTSAVAAIAVAVAMALLSVWALQQRREAEKAQVEAEKARVRAGDNALMAGAREQMERVNQEVVTHLLLEVKQPEQVYGWKQLALDALVMGIPRQTLRGHEATVNSASFSPDGQRIVTASDDDTARVWRADGKGEPVVLRGHADTVRSASFSPDGRSIVTASKDRTARVWRADGQGPPVVLQGHQDLVYSASFSPDGRSIVTASRDKTARVWRGRWPGLPRGAPMPSGLRLSASFSPDGRSIVTTSGDNTARVWQSRWPGHPRGAPRPSGPRLLRPASARTAAASSPPRMTKRPGCGEPMARAPPWCSKASGPPHFGQLQPGRPQHRHRSG